MKNYLTILISIVFSLVLSVSLYASCGSASCPLYHFHYNQAGGLHLRLSYEYINQNEVFVGSNKSFVGAIPEDHDEVSTINAITLLQLQYGISDRLGINLLMP